MKANIDIDKEMLNKWKGQLKSFPKTPGVYLMKNNLNQIIYIGKAKNLKDRISSYFIKNPSDRIFYKTYFLIRQIHKIDYIQTKTEVEAFLLEASLVKKHHPKYNVRLKDDKAYPYIRLTLQDPFPRFYVSRRVKQDGSVYFGPYTQSSFVKDIMHILNQTFQIRDCSDSFFKNRTRPCLTHQIGHCSAPCVGLISQKKYTSRINQALEFLRGQNQKLFNSLNQQMQKAASLEQFEVAARIRDILVSMQKALDKLPLMNKNSKVDQDVIGYFGNERGTLLVILHIRNGRHIGQHTQLFSINARSHITDLKNTLISFINQYYVDNIVPDQLIIPIQISKKLECLIQEALAKRGHKQINVRFPIDDQGSQLLQKADLLAHDLFKEQIQKSDQKSQGLLEIQKRFALKEFPKRIECFDISTLQGKQTVASQVVFENGLPAKEYYRRYKIKKVSKTDDFASMKEVLSRRLHHTEHEDPQLILIDGGKGQLGVVVEVLKELGRDDIPVVALAKARSLFSQKQKKIKLKKKAQSKEVSGSKAITATQNDHSEERFFLPGRKNPIVFKSQSQPFQILVSLRNEAHRFAITHHRKLRSKSTIESQLDHIKGLGQQKKILLLEHFQSVENIKKATTQEIGQLKGFNQILAERIHLSLKNSS